MSCVCVYGYHSTLPVCIRSKLGPRSLPSQLCPFSVSLQIRERIGGVGKPQLPRGKLRGDGLVKVDWRLTVSRTCHNSPCEVGELKYEIKHVGRPIRPDVCGRRCGYPWRLRSNVQSRLAVIQILCPTPSALTNAWHRCRCCC
jgi:hypothetical protein